MTTESKLRELEPGLYVDDETGSMHLFMTQFLNLQDVPVEVIEEPQS